MEYRNRILIVDDDDFLRESLEDDLREHYEVFAASSGEEALELLSEVQRLALILLDVKMPGMSGYEVHERIKDMPVCHEVPVIYLTGLTHPDEEKKGLGTGAADFLTKPCETDILLARVENRLRNAKRLDLRKLAGLPETFSELELTILQYMALSYSNEEIAEKTGYVNSYVRKIVMNVMQKLHMESRRDAKRFIIE